MTWQRYKLNLRNSLHLEEYFLVMEQFDSTLSSVIGSTLGLRCRSFGYRYSEIIRSLMSKGMLWAEVVYSSLYLSDNSVMRGRVHAKRTLRGLVADLRLFFIAWGILILVAQKVFEFAYLDWIVPAALLIGRILVAIIY